MYEPKDVARRGACAQVHLRGSIAFGRHNLIAKARREFSRSIGTPPIRDNDLSFGRSLTEMREKSRYQRRLVKNRNNDRNLHSSVFR
jgi:hypothetical protein